MANILKTGLVLEGGAMRGMFTAGILDVFIENDIRFDGVIGVSAGAIFGVNYLSGQKGRVIRYNKIYNSDREYMGLKSLLKTGDIINTEYAYHRVPYELDKFDDEAFKKSGVPFYCVLTDIVSGKPEYAKITSVFEQMDYLRASATLPFVSKPVAINYRLYLDGGVTDSIPYKKFMEMGYEKLVVILTRDVDYIKKPMKKLPVKMYYGKYPRFAEKMLSRYENYNNSIKGVERLEKEGKAVIIRPKEPIKIGRLERNPDKLQKVYDMGIEEGKRSIERIKSALS